MSWLGLILTGVIIGSLGSVTLGWFLYWLGERRRLRRIAAIRKGEHAAFEDGEFGVFHPFDGTCPDCGEKNNWIEGPHGGMSINIKCAGCGLWLNHCPPLGLAERLGRRD